MYCYLAMKTKQKDDQDILSEYEQQRLKRIEENTRMLVQLVSQTKKNFIDNVSTDTQRYTRV